MIFFSSDQNIEKIKSGVKNLYFGKRNYNIKFNSINVNILLIHKYSIKFPIGNGYITTATLREILAALDDKLTSEDLDGIIAEIDTDGSGTVDFDGL